MRTLGVYDKDILPSAEHKQLHGIFAKECTSAVSTSSICAAIRSHSEAVLSQQQACYNISESTGGSSGVIIQNCVFRVNAGVSYSDSVQK